MKKNKNNNDNCNDCCNNRNRICSFFHNFTRITAYSLPSYVYIIPHFCVLVNITRHPIH